jgi:uncharacterized protein
MLIGFKLRNFRSFLDEQAFFYAMPPGRVRESIPTPRTVGKAIRNLSKIAVVFGPNAGGKTNFVRALSTLRDLVLHSTTLTDEKFSEHYAPFQFGPSAQRPTDFEIDVLLNQVRYRYSLSYDGLRVTSERLLVYRTGKSQRWFERRYDEATRTESWMPFSSSFHGPRDLWRKVTRPNGLFFTTAVQLNCGQLKPLFQWFEHEFEIVLPADTVDLTRTATRVGDGVFKERLLNLLRSVDIPMVDVRVAERDSAASGKLAAPASPQGHLSTCVRASRPNGWTPRARAREPCACWVYLGRCWKRSNAASCWSWTNSTSACTPWWPDS